MHDNPSTTTCTIEEHRYRITLSGDTTTSVAAASATVQPDGTLVFSDGCGQLMRAYAPASWKVVWRLVQDTGGAL